VEQIQKMMNNLLTFGLLCWFILSFPATGLADSIIYGANAYGRTDMIEINLTQNTYQKVGDIAFGTQAIEQDPETGYVYYFEWTNSSDEFAYWDPATATNTIVRTYDPPPGFYPKRLAFSPGGTLYGMDHDDRIGTINKHTGDITLLGHVTGLETGDLKGTGDMAFAPDGTLYVVTYQSLYTVDHETLVATLLYSDLIQGEGIMVWSGLAYCDGLLYASDIEATDNNDPNPLSQIYSIDPATGELTELFYIHTLLNDLTSCPAGAPPLNHPPVLDPVGAKTVFEGELLEFAITASDPDAGDGLIYSADNLPSGAVFDPVSQIFSWTPVFDDIGDHTVTFKVSDDGSPPLSDSEAVTISVNSITFVELKGESDTEDTAIGNKSSSLLNYGGSPATFAVGSYGIIARSLIRWDISSIPPGSTILSAQMSLYSYQNYTGGIITIDAHRVLKPWIEGTLDARNRRIDAPDSSCWTEYGNGATWDVEGADGLNDRDAAIISSATNEDIGWYSWDITEAVQKWVDGEWANNGLLLKSDNENSDNLKMFAPSEYQDETFRPSLIIEYMQP
jgi:hypothetical protein